MIIVVMGVSGSGKSTVGTLLAKQLGWAFRDGDEFHPESNVAKMRSGTPLNDEDRRPWLMAIQAFMRGEQAAGRSAVIACSALKESYRELLLKGESWVRFVHLTGPRAVIEDRMRSRAGHFMPVALLESQLATLESPGDAWVEDLRSTPEQIVARLVARVAGGEGCFGRAGEAGRGG